MSDIETFVNGKITGNKVVIFSKSYCPHCANTKKIFAEEISKGECEVLEIDTVYKNKMDKIQAYMKKETGASSVPRVFINGKFQGGNDDMVRKKKSGELQKLLEK